MAAKTGKTAKRKTMSALVYCYNRYEYWPSRANAKKMYLEGMMCCEGSEQERYTNIYCQLEQGATYATDDYDEKVSVKTMIGPVPCGDRYLFELGMDDGSKIYVGMIKRKNDPKRLIEVVKSKVFEECKKLLCEYVEGKYL